MVPVNGLEITGVKRVTLYIDAVWLLPPFVLLLTRWYAESARTDSLAPSGSGKVIGTYLAGSFGVALACAAITAITIRMVAYGLGVPDHVARALGQAPAETNLHVLAYFIGIPLSLAVTWAVLLKPGRPFHRLLKPLWMTVDGPTIETELPVNGSSLGRAA